MPATHGPIGRREAELVKEPSPVKRVFKLLGPGFITGASDADPTSIGTCAKAGATLGFSSLWLAVLVFPLLAGTQFICSKIGMVTLVVMLIANNPGIMGERVNGRLVNGLGWVTCAVMFVIAIASLLT